MGSTADNWQNIAKKKQQEIKAAIPPKWVIPDEKLPSESQADVSDFLSQSGFFTNREIEIVSTDALKTLSYLSNGSWQSEDVTSAYCKAAAAAHQLTNCLSEIFFDEAIAQAKECDDYLRKHGRPKGPFHGFPISIKDNFNIIGKPSTIGIALLANTPATYNSTIVDLILQAGAVLYVKTNVPTAVMLAETVNNVTGRTLNPLNRSLTSGGSSGGESALIAFGGSRIGLGSDIGENTTITGEAENELTCHEIGGSLRIPAACTGIFTIRPSAGRFPHCRARSGLAGQEAVMSVNGPLAKTLEEIVFYSKTIIDQKPWLHDPKCLPIPWRTVESKRRLKLAVMWNDGLVTPTPPVARALKETVEKLKAAGHELVDWEPAGHKDVRDLLRRMFVADGAKSIRKLLEPTGEPFRPEMGSYEKSQEMGVYEMWQLQVERSDLQKSYLDHWNSVGDLDGILCPTTPYSSVEHGKLEYAGYTGAYNLLDYSAVSFPCGIKADEKLDTAYSGHNPLSEFDVQVQGSYNANLVHGMPVSLQLVARRLEEEKVLVMTETVLKSL
ncbi:hypothetical protein N7474_008528 [Penicillium riverlandense]|uniref:uncharacterized protein n=1 Tax=Penicillium riverlandense TaxID=1903569 RepID=UPI002546B720|nr:uncharacterized protein N7474_008528 [Penicillium riverlandense]KAJ5812227.1 hypothetical protein N7474_008528 [Penicillium riverlandense]